MYERASVVTVNADDTVTVMCTTEACSNCQAGAFCSTKGKTFTAHNDTGIPLHTGDTVELYLPPGKTIIAGFIALLVPILLFPVGYYLPSLVSHDIAEWVRIIAGIGGIALGFGISRTFSRLKSREYTPQITRILEPQGP